MACRHGTPEANLCDQCAPMVYPPKVVREAQATAIRWAAKYRRTDLSFEDLAEAVERGELTPS